MNTLQQQLTDQGLPTRSLGGGKILISQFGGRVLALCPDGETNLFWINPDFSRHLDDRRAGREWANLGGERAWVSPEVDTNVPDPADFVGSYSVQPALDPGDYQLTEDDCGIVLRNRARARWLRLSAQIELETERRFHPLDNPPPLPGLPDNLLFAGYEMTGCLRIHQRPEGARPALWNLIQLPGGGIAKATARDGAEPAAIIGDPIWERTGSVMHSSFPVEASYKWSLHASESLGRLGYRRTLPDGRVSLVVRDFPLTTDADYPDCPVTDQTDTGHACQVYLDDGAMGGFAEIEFHCPAVPVGESQSPSITCQTYGWIGDASSIDTVESLLDLNF